MMADPVMADPVMAADGHSYERAAIESWFAQQREIARHRLRRPLMLRSPWTNEVLDSAALIPNHTLRRVIEEYRQQHGS